MKKKEIFAMQKDNGHNGHRQESSLPPQETEEVFDDWVDQLRLILKLPAEHLGSTASRHAEKAAEGSDAR